MIKNLTHFAVIFGEEGAVALKKYYNIYFVCNKLNFANDSSEISESNGKFKVLQILVNQISYNKQVTIIMIIT